MSLSKFAGLSKKRFWIALAATMIGVIVTRADTVKLKDGNVLEGDIVSETLTNVTMEVELARGTIANMQIIPRDEIDTIARSTAEERTAREMNREFNAALRYRLDPSHTFDPAYYDKILNGVFRRYLTKYPDSPHTARIQELITQWEAERDQARMRRQEANLSRKTAPSETHETISSRQPITKTKFGPTQGFDNNPELLSSIWNWLGENWYIPVGVVLVGLWLLGRAYS